MTAPGSLFGQKVIGVTVYVEVSATGDTLVVSVLHSPTEQIGSGTSPVVKSTPETVAHPFFEIFITILLLLHITPFIVAIVYVVFVLSGGVIKLPAPEAFRTIVYCVPDEERNSTVAFGVPESVRVIVEFGQIEIGGLVTLVKAAFTLVMLIKTLPDKLLTQLAVVIVFSVKVVFTFSAGVIKLPPPVESNTTLYEPPEEEEKLTVAFGVPKNVKVVFELGHVNIGGLTTFVNIAEIIFTTTIPLILLLQIGISVVVVVTVERLNVVVVFSVGVVKLPVPLAFNTIL